jgi:hypothetical protein
MAKQEWFSVSFRIVDTEKEYVPRTKIVSISEGYSEFEDIRKILAISLGLKVENIAVDAIVRLEK